METLGNLDKQIAEASKEKEEEKKPEKSEEAEKAKEGAKGETETKPKKEAKPEKEAKAAEKEVDKAKAPKEEDKEAKPGAKAMEEDKAKAKAEEEKKAKAPGVGKVDDDANIEALRQLAEEMGFLDCIKFETDPAPDDIDINDDLQKEELFGIKPEVASKEGELKSMTPTPKVRKLSFSSKRPHPLVVGVI